MIGWEAVPTMFSAGMTFGLECMQHQRANHLHREAEAQALRIHEAEAYATMEYHRVVVEMANTQHKSSIMQACIQHEEMMDQEKRIAIRENIRDEWAQITERAGTVLIVNTLVLSVGFGMLVDGPLPPSITMTHNVLTVAYFCSLSTAINLLLCSVRFAMLLRFRVGRLVVKEMQKAIKKSQEEDEKFRKHHIYKKFNRPVVTIAACDDEDRKHFVQPLTAHMRQPEQEKDG